MNTNNQIEKQIEKWNKEKNFYPIENEKYKGDGVWEYSKQDAQTYMRDEGHDHWNGECWRGWDKETKEDVYIYPVLIKDPNGEEDDYITIGYRIEIN